MPRNTFLLFTILFLIGVVLFFTVESGFLRSFGISTAFLSPIMLLILWIEARGKRKN
jgi:hypothetical protein